MLARGGRCQNGGRRRSEPLFHDESLKLLAGKFDNQRLDYAKPRAFEHRLRRR